MIAVGEHVQGCVLPVRAQPGARRRGIVGEQGGALKIAVNVAPENGKANKALIEVLCEAFGLKKQQVELLSGQTSRDKKFLLRGVTAQEIQARCEEVVRDD